MARSNNPSSPPTSRRCARGRRRRNTATRKPSTNARSSPKAWDDCSRQVAQRLNGQGGEPVIQLQTAFGGGKTHTLLAVYHLASLFLAPDHGALTRLRDCIRVALAWNSIVEDVAAMRLVLDNLQAEQAKKELKAAEDVLPRVARECYKWLLCPSQDNPTGKRSKDNPDNKPTIVPFSLNTSGTALGPEIERV